jgi:hypothetical protein
MGKKTFPHYYNDGVASSRLPQKCNILQHITFETLCHGKTLSLCIFLWQILPIIYVVCLLISSLVDLDTVQIR